MLLIGVLFNQSFAQRGAVVGPVFATRGYPVFDVMAYKAKGDGVTDDSAAVQTVIDAAETAGGGIVYFPIGTYIINGEIDVKSNIFIEGEGPGNTILDFSNNGGDKQGLKIYSRTNSGVRNLTIQGVLAGAHTDERAAIDLHPTLTTPPSTWSNSLSSTDILIENVIFEDNMIAVRLGGAKRVRIENCWAMSGASSGDQANAFRLVPHPNVSPVSGNRKVEDVWIEDTYIHATNMASAIRLTGSNGNEEIAHSNINIINVTIDTAVVFVSIVEATVGLNIENCDFRNSTSHGIWFDDGTKGIDVFWDLNKVTDTKIQNVASGKTAIYVTHTRTGTTADNFSFIDNEIDGNDLTSMGIWINNTSGTFSSGHKITNNTTISMANSGIYIKKVRDSNVSGNISRLNGWDGLLIVDSNANIASANVFNRNSRDGIRIQNSNRNGITVNNVSDNGDTSIAGGDNGIFIISDSDENVIVGNIAEGSQSTGNMVRGLKINTGDCNLNLVTGNIFERVDTSFVDDGANTIMGWNIYDHTTSNIIAFADGDATPDVSGGSFFKTANTSATTITRFDGLSGRGGPKWFWLEIGDNFTTLQHSKNSGGYPSMHDNQNHKPDSLDALMFYYNGNHLMEQGPSFDGLRISRDDSTVYFIMQSAVGGISASSVWYIATVDTTNDVAQLLAEGNSPPAVTEYAITATVEGNVGIGGVPNPEHTAQVAGELALQEQASAPDSTTGYTVIYADQNKRVIIRYDDGTYDTLGVGGAFNLYDGAKRVGGGSYLADSTFTGDESPSLQLDITVTPVMLVACTASGIVRFIPEARDTPGSAGSDLISSSMTATTSCDTVNTFVGGDITAGKIVVADIDSASGATGFLWMLHFTNTNDIINSHVHDEIVSANDSNRVQVDETPGENKIRIDVAGVEVGVWDSERLTIAGEITTTDTLIYQKTMIDTVKNEDDFPFFEAPYALTLHKVRASTKAGTVPFQLKKRAWTAAWTAGTNMLSAELTADTDGAETTSFSVATMAKGDELAFVVGTTTGGPTGATWKIYYTKD